ncbi:MAG: ribbon-helix-helix protein, CopG family [Planctomycetes bacterium]|nr:ribbon-helix-helix protein, CopG family [Planctomycetota bacterium]MBI3846558.1 ribbon-helix-helix protein, CopG family [Planctomycetota bacterium]
MVRQRINITLSEETIAVIDRLAKKAGVNRSRFLDQAARYYVQAMGKSSLKKLLVEGATVRAQEHRAMAEDWFPADAEAWARLR